MESTKSNSSAAGVASVSTAAKVGPIFRIVDPNAKKDEKANTTSQTAKHEDAQFQDKRRSNLYANDTGPYWHKMSNPMITPPIIAQNLPLQFKDLPIFGAPECPAKLDEYEQKRIREFVGSDLDNAELEELERYCNPDNLKTGKEIKMMTTVPIPGLISKNLVKEVFSDDNKSDAEDKQLNKELCVLRKLRRRQLRDVTNSYPRCLKYRGVKQLPLREQEDIDAKERYEPPDLEPGEEVVYRIRVYRPFTFQLTGEKHVRGRHSVFHCDIVALGSSPLTALRDRFSCRNDLDLRLDRSASPDRAPPAAAKDVFPSGFLFINNVFYVDGRAGCRDTAAAVRRWAHQKGLGDFPARRMEDFRLDQIRVKLAHPEVYVHQGACEHVFLFSEARLLGRADPARRALYPRHGAVSQNQTIYCTTCAEFGARWLVAGSARVPFDPAFFCELCFRLYLYRGADKLGAFRAYAYRGNELSLRANEPLAYL